MVASIATNAAVALSDDARLVAYASGGEEKSHAVIRERLDRRDPRPVGIACGI